MMRCFRIERRVPSEAETSTMLSRALDRRSMAEAAAATRLQWRGQERLQHLLCLGHAPFADLQMSDMTTRSIKYIAGQYRLLYERHVVFSLSIATG